MSLFDPDPSDKLARNSDPETSKKAAKRLKLTLQPGDDEILRFLDEDVDMATHDQIADHLVKLGRFKRHEPARRRIRVLTENYGLLELVIDPATGKVVTDVNDSGADARCWRISGPGRMELARWRADNP